MIFGVLAELWRHEGPPSGSHTHIGKQGNPSIDFLVVIMTSGIAHGHDDEDESRKIAVILPRFMSFFDTEHLCHVN